MTRGHSGTLRRAAAVLAVAALVGCDGGSGAADDTTAGRPLTGTFTVTVSSGVDDPCAPLADHPDLVEGAPVVVTDSAGVTVATGTLGEGRVDDDACIRGITVAPMPAASTFHVSVGPYGPIEVTAEALAAAGGTLDLRLGV